MPVEGGQGSPGAGAGGNAGSAGGQQGAVTPEQIQAIQAALLPSINQAITGALHSRLERLGIDDLKTTVQGLAERLSAGAGGGSSGGGAGGKGKDDELAQLRTELAKSTEQANQHRAELARERKANALRDALVAAGCRDVTLALQSLTGRADIKAEADANGSIAWIGEVTGPMGDTQKATLNTVVSAFLKSHPTLAPAVGGGGSGAGGARPNGMPSVGSKPLDQMSAEDYAALPVEQRRALADAAFGTSRRGGFFSRE